MSVTIQQQHQAAERELNLRRRVYPRWVVAKRMSQAKADEEIANMEAIVETLQALCPPVAKQVALPFAGA